MAAIRTNGAYSSQGASGNPFLPRSMRMIEADGSPGGGGGGTPAGDPPAPAPLIAPAPKMISEDEANSRAAAARREATAAKDAATARATQLEAELAALRGGTPPPKPTPPPPPAPQTPTSDRDFEDQLGDVLAESKLTRDQKSLVRRLAREDKAAGRLGSVEEFVTNMTRTFGIVPTAPPAPAAVPGTPAIPAPANSPGAPSSAVPLERNASVLEWSAEQVHDFLRKNGGDPSQPYSWRANRAPGREIRRQWESAMRGGRISLKSFRHD